VTAGANVAGELVDSNGTVVAVVDQTSNNPFVLTAPEVGTYTLNAGYRQPQRRWDSLRVNITTTGVGGPGMGNPDAYFKLDQNYPNPFNPKTDVRFSIASFGFVSLRVYDVLGREVATLVEGQKHHGRYEVEWNAEGFPSGVYFYRLRAGELVQTKKLLLLR
jgi:hypothetical protein